MPTVATGGASAMSPMQFVGTPGTNMPKTDMRNAMGNRKRKYAPLFCNHSSIYFS
jgi:mediator of RNA polymerase II transcription subunit 31